MINNFSLFDKYLNKISTSTIDKFGSFSRVSSFLNLLCEKGSIALAASESRLIPPLQIPALIKKDKYFGKCVELALSFAGEAAEGVLYDRAINGYEELIFNKAGECISRRKKYCSKCLLEYLKANSPKYQTSTKEKKQTEQKAGKDQTAHIAGFEIESYEAKAG